MSLVTKPQSVLLVMVLLTCVEMNADTQGPETGVLSDPSKEKGEEKSSQEAAAEGGAQQQHLPSNQQQLNVQVENQLDNQVQKQAANIQDGFRVSNTDTQEQSHQHEPPQENRQQEVQHSSQSQLPLGQTDQDKGQVQLESDTQSKTDTVSEEPNQQSHTVEGAHDNVLAEDSDLQAPFPEQMPLSKPPSAQDVQPQHQQQQNQPSSSNVDTIFHDQTSKDGVEGSADVERGGDYTGVESSADVERGGDYTGVEADEHVGDENLEAGRVLSEEEIEGERLFQAGEKLINATYYKEYKEAYLHFLQASQLNHREAKEYVAFGHLFGDYLPQNVTRATELFNELADVGSPKAQMGLAFMYSAGFHYNSSQAKGLIYLTFGALGGDPLAQMALGYRFYAGIGVESKCETALTYYRKVATKVADSVTLAGGPVVQRIRLQEETESQGTNNSPLLDDDLLQYYHFLADKGDQQAQVVLGTLYYQGGKGVQINHEQAYHYFSTAAESGSGHALGYLGKMHSEGSPVVTQSNHTAFEYFKKSADKNNHIGQTGLGMVYLNGLGVEKDTSKAFRYFSLASDQGSVDAQLQLGIMYFTGNGVRKDYKMAVKYFTMSSQNGHVLAFYNLAQMHATGTGVLRNCHTAVELFKNVAERGRWSEMLMDAHRMYHEGSVDTALVKYMFLAELGYEVAQSNVAYILDSGASYKFSRYETHQRALLQYSRAASQGSTNARLKMGDYHYYGLGTDVDYESAATHYRLASEQQHNAQAMFNLGYMHEKGLGLKQDVHLAKRFYDMAAETSLDAHVPVTLALFKLGLFYGMDVFSKEFEGVSGIVGLLDPAAYLGPEWDIYLATVFAIMFGILFFLRRMR